MLIDTTRVSCPDQSEQHFLNGRPQNKRAAIAPSSTSCTTTIYERSLVEASQRWKGSKGRAFSVLCPTGVAVLVNHEYRTA